MEEIMSMENKKKGFNWLAFIFSYAYYAGYGRIPKALALAVAACIPVVFIGVPLYAGFKANADLPIGEQAFSWPKAILFAVIGASLFSGAMSLIQFMKG
jgi:hypothetical protein